MPVFIENLTQASQQDLIDLTDLYDEQSAELLMPFANSKDLVEQSIAQQQLYVCRFNGRLLGAAVLDKQADQWLLSHLCVRQLTWRRGVAKRLLEVVSQQAKEQVASLILLVPKDQQIMHDYGHRHGLAVRQLSQ